MTQKLVSLKNNLLIIILSLIITTRELNNLATDVFDARLAQANLITKTDFDANLSSLNRKITGNMSKHLLVGNELKTFDSRCFIDKNHLQEDGTKVI